MSKDNEEQEQDPRALAKRDADKVRQRAAAKAEAEPESVEDDDVEQTPVDEPEEDDAAPLSRTDKKRNRYREMQERAEAAERERAEYAGRLEQMQRLYEDARRQPTPQQQSEPQRDDLSEKLDAVYREQDLLYRELQARGKTLTQDDITKYEKRARELDEQKHELIAERKLRTAQPQGGQPPDVAAVTAFLQLQYPDVYGNQQALGWAQARYQQLRFEGRQSGYELLQETMAETRQRFRLGGGGMQRPAAPAAQPGSRTAKYSGAPRGGGGGAGDPDETITVPRKPEYMRMARSVYAHIAKQNKGKSVKQIEDIQWKMWVNGPGKRHIARQRGQQSRG